MRFTIGYGARFTRRFGYRTAAPVGTFLQLEYREGDAIAELYNTLLAHFEVVGSNHDGYEITREDGSKLYLFFSDWRLHIASGFAARDAAGRIVNTAEPPDADGE